jgi:DNA-nicking Smr family endonuclease
MFGIFKRHKMKEDSTEDRASVPEEEESEMEPVVVTDVLDLHGFFPEQVPEILDEFIRNAVSLGLHRLRIIHGKGKSRLKHAVLHELKQRPEVASYGDAPSEFGGWGATVVFLKEGLPGAGQGH